MWEKIFFGMHLFFNFIINVFIYLLKFFGLKMQYTKYYSQCSNTAAVTVALIKQQLSGWSLITT